MNIRNIEHFSEIDEMYDIYEDDRFDEMMINPDLGDDRIIISGPLYRLCNSNLIIAEGTYYAYDEDTGELEPDFSVSLLYDFSAGEDFDKPLYWQQDSPATMFHYYVRMQESMGNISHPVAVLESEVA